MASEKRYGEVATMGRGRDIPLLGPTAASYRRWREIDLSVDGVTVLSGVDIGW